MGIVHLWIIDAQFGRSLLCRVEACTNPAVLPIYLSICPEAVAMVCCPGDAKWDRDKLPASELCFPVAGHRLGRLYDHVVAVYFQKPLPALMDSSVLVVFNWRGDPLGTK